MDNNILSLSGGNQQKVLFARALGSDADDHAHGRPDARRRRRHQAEVYAHDPCRGRVAGRTFVWYTTEMDELQHCDHVYVFRDGRIVADLPRHAGDRGGRAACLVPGAGVRSLPPWRRHLREALPALSLAALLLAVFWLQPRAMSYVGLNLMLNLAVPIAFATIAQMFVITVNELDLSHRHLCRLRRLRGRHLADRDAAARRGGAGGRDPGLCRRSAP